MGDMFGVKVEGTEELLRKLEELGVDLRELLVQATVAGGEVISEGAADAAPGDGITAEVVSKKAQSVEVGIGPDKEHWYYRFAEYGAQPHEISPETAKALVFEGPGGTVFAGGASHPGMAARPFLRPAITDKAADASTALGAVLEKALEKGGK